MNNVPVYGLRPVLLILSQGGGKVGEIVSAEVEGVGFLTFVYCADPEGNIIELQSWRY